MSKKFIKRFLISIVLWIWFGFVCTWLASGNYPDIRWSTMMRTLLFNRFFIWFAIAFIGVYTIHPLFWFRCYPRLRWLVRWAVISLNIAIGVFLSAGDRAQQVKIFRMTILAWAIYGLIIDLIATWIGWQGKMLLNQKNK